jgi:hypothetical protein
MNRQSRLTLIKFCAKTGDRRNIGDIPSTDFPYRIISLRNHFSTESDSRADFRSPRHFNVSRRPSQSTELHLRQGRIEGLAQKAGYRARD